MIPELDWERSAFEKKLGFPAAKYTGCNLLVSFLGAGFLSVLFYLMLYPFRASSYGSILYERGPMPYCIVFLSAWSLVTLLIKWRKIRLQERALQYSVVPDSRDFVLSPRTADEVHGLLYDIADNPEKFMVLNRIERAISSLRNIGRVSDVDDIMRSQAENDENHMESTYTALRGFIWSIPIFGFIGTVLGLSSAIGEFGSVLSRGAEMEQLRGALEDVTGGLAVAFDTTLLGLVAAVIIQLILTLVRRKEEMLLDRCSEYCHQHIVSRLRTIPVEDEHGIEGNV